MVEYTISIHIFYVLIVQGKLIEIGKRVKKLYRIVNRIVAPVSRSVSYREVPVSWHPYFVVWGLIALDEHTVLTRAEYRSP